MPIPVLPPPPPPPDVYESSREAVFYNNIRVWQNEYGGAKWVRWYFCFWIESQWTYDNMTISFLFQWENKNADLITIGFLILAYK